MGGVSRSQTGGKAQGWALSAMLKNKDFFFFSCQWSVLDGGIISSNYFFPQTERFLFF